MEILDVSGKLVRRYSSNDHPETEAELLQTLEVPLYWVGVPRILSAEAGMDRFVWDLRNPAPQSTRHEYPISANPHDTPRLPQGPSVPPGEYTVRLTVDGHSYTAPLTVKMDPRVKTPRAGLEQQFHLETRLASMMSVTYKAAGQARAGRTTREAFRESN